jgi:hypothetical protein
VTLFRGYTYVFDIDCPNNPLSIKFKRTVGELDRYNDGVIGNGQTTGKIIFEVPFDAPDVLYYTSETNLDAGGVFHILDINENTFLNVDQEILGKKTFTMTNGYKLSNGMKLKFTGNILPEIYSKGFWYVEGVGTSIKLISEKDLEILTTYSEDITMLFDDEPFDQTAFSSATTYSKYKDYLVINRGSIDKNPWSRYNRWYHQDVILISDEIAGSTVGLDQNARATRPIIEFEAGLKLFNFGHVSKIDVDLIDTVTTDVFSNIEGQLGYVIDGIPLVEGMRVLFTADTDTLVKNKIYNVTFVEINKPQYIINFYGTAGINTTANTITFNETHKLVNGSKIIYRNNGNINTGGLFNGKTYYASVVDSYIIKLYFDQTLTTEVPLLNKTTGIHSFDVVGQTRTQIHFVEAEDTTPKENEVVLVRQGSVSQGKMYWFNGQTWVKGQEKFSQNQAPLFDVFDSTGLSYSNESTYSGSTFTGSKIFSYKVSDTGTVDSELGFALSYQNIDNIGDILFNFNLLQDTFNYKTSSVIETKNINAGFLKMIKTLESFEYVNGWEISKVLEYQPIVRVYKNETVEKIIDGVKTVVPLINNFPIDVYDNVDDLSDLKIRVYVNGVRLNPSFYTIETGTVRKFIKILDSYEIKETDVVSIKCFAKQSKNKNGYYEVPINLQNNPLNNDITSFTLGEVITHVDSIVENLDSFDGDFPGASNLRDLGIITPYGTKFVQHSSPTVLGLLHLASKEFNIVKALQQSKDDYGKFKRAFIVTATNSGIDTDTRRHVDYILNLMRQNKSKFEPYYFSDMFGLGAYNKLDYIIDNSLVKKYPITNIFSMTSLSNKAVNVYINGEQLLHGIDYIFGDDHYIEFLIDLTEEALIEIIEYESTDGCYCPSTPSKLGLYPLFEPKKFTDDTYLEPVEVIQGHDGSITLAYGDFRDDLILELEKRIFNNVKISYDKEKFNIHNFIPAYGKSTDFSRQEFERVLGTYFYQWTTLIGQDFTKQLYYDRLNPFTFNYRDNYAPDGTEVPAFWRGAYKWFLNTDRPHTHPWECLELTIKPAWWDEVYGPAPYTSDNQILWNDLQQGIVRAPGKPPKKNDSIARTILQYGVPVDAEGNLIDPVNANFVAGVIKPTSEGYYIFGDQGPVEATWRKSSYYPFALIQTLLLLNPAKTLSLAFDLSRIQRNNAGQLVYKDTGLRIRLKDVVVPTLPQSSQRSYTAGLVNYVIDYITSDSQDLVNSYKEALSLLTVQIGSKLGGFTSKAKFNLVLDSKNPSSTGGVFIPEENFSIFLNTSSPIKKLNYSGIIITKYTDGFELKGYNFEDPFFKFYGYELTDRVINVGGISETFVNWEEGKTYSVGTNVKYNNVYYKTTVTFTATDTFSTVNLVKLPALPMVGGVDAYIRKTFNKREELILSYGTKLTTIQEVADFIQGYGEYLKDQGFIFDTFNNTLQTVSNWETSLKEFLFWTTQNWGEGAVLSISPSAGLLSVRADYSVINDILDPFYDYKIFRVDGQKLDYEFTNITRTENIFSLQPVKTNHGIYGATLYLVQKEHALVIDNKTLFNDVIYDLNAGIKQEKIKVLGYLTSGWSGGFDVPGFIFDQAKIYDWQPWVDYSLGDVVKYGAFYYSATKKILGTENFNDVDWYRLNDKPEKVLKANWDYRAQQFTDFYDLDTSNFDAEQQKFAQHLIGYQKRQYLQNIIQDDVSQYNFYQGYIREKGTQNSLSKLFDVLSADDTDSLTFNEEWAVRVGQYGASSGFDEVEFILDESKFKLKPQPIEVVEQTNSSSTDLVYRQQVKDLYIKPKNFVSLDRGIFPTTGTKQFLRSPGFVRYDDVALYIDSLDDLVGTKVFELKDGDYIWCAFENGLSTDHWNVYRTTTMVEKIEAITYANKTLTIELNTKSPVTAGGIIAISNPSIVTGYYKVTSTNQDKILITTNITGWDPITDLSKTVIYTFEQCKINSIDDLNQFIPNKIKDGELVWSKDNGQGLWAVYKNSKIFKDSAVDTTFPVEDGYFGKFVSITKDGTLAAVSSKNFTTILTKTFSSSAWNELQKIPTPTQVETDSLVTKFSPDKQLLLIGHKNIDGSYYEIHQKNNVGQYVYISGFPVYEGAFATGFTSHLKTIDIVNYKDSYTVAVATNNEVGLFNIYTPLEITSTVTLGSNFIAYPGADEKFYLAQVSAAVLPTNTQVSNVINGVGFEVNSSFTGSGIYDFNISFGIVFPTIFSGASSDVKLSDQASTFIVSLPSTNQVKVYKRTGLDTWNLAQTINGSSVNTTSRFGESIDITADASEFLVSSPYNVLGKISVYKLNNNSYQLSHEITSPYFKESGNFGTNVSYSIDNKTIVVVSKNSSIISDTTFDVYSKLLDRTVSQQLYGSNYINDEDSIKKENSTTFDNNSTNFVTVINGGKVDIFDKYNNNYIYGETLKSRFIGEDITDLSSTDGFASSVSSSENTILVGTPYHDIGIASEEKNVGRIYSYSRNPNATSWAVLHQQESKPNVNKIKKAFLYDSVEQKLIQYLDIVEPNQGKIPGIAEQEIRFKSYFDPAIYSTGDSSVNVNDGVKWTKSKVGLLWWDLNRAKFLENSIGDVVYRSTTWNTLYASASIDIYEWVESKYLPSEWDKLADTEKGLANNISGKSKYGDLVYSEVQTYDTVSKKFISVYYFWVKNKTVVPNVLGRTLSSAEIANLIADPRSYGYACLALTGPNSFSVVNTENLLTNTHTVLSVQYWTIENQELNIHNQWKLLSESSLYIPENIEKKWINSLIGKDDNDKPLPDSNLPFKLRYGVEFKPRQSMFVNRGEALKLFIEGVNSVLANNLITDNYNISPLEKLDDAPSKYSGLWDTQISTNSLLRFISTGALRPAVLEPVIENGRITDVIIIDAGNGYVNAPYIKIIGDGTGAEIRTVLDANGSVVNVKINNKGVGYNLANTSLTIRNFSVLIDSDENSFDKWAIYSYNSIKKSWTKIISQAFNTNSFWSYIDWYATGYNEFTKIDYFVNNTYELANLKSNIGETVKVKNIGTGGWLLLEKFANNTTIDYTQNYSVIGRENGTIKFLPTLYDFSNSTVGYDTNLFDSAIYDSFALNELRIILDCIKNNLLIEELRSEYIKLFFASLRFVLREQPFVDWVTKTSFVVSKHNVGALVQKVNYNNDNLSDYESYINEVKPYRTNIREYVSSYKNIDNTQTMVSDFDIIPYVNPDYDITKLFLKVNELSQTQAVIESSSDEILNTYPWKNWKDNLGFSVLSIEVANGGSGYINPPIVKISGGYGTGATARAYISNGVVNRITVTNPGYGYLKAPTVLLDGGLSVNGIAGKAVAIIETQAVRANKISVKFDRITNNYFIYEITETEIFYGTGSRLQFDLKYSPVKTVGNSKVRIVNGEEYLADPTNPGTEVLRNEYQLATKKTKNRGFTSYYGSLTLSSPPAAGDVVIIEYEKDISYLSAADRINFFYNVESGKWGKDLSQLMTGIDYGGVNITGLGFRSVGGWDALPWFSDAWDSFDEDYDNLSVVQGANDHTVQLKYTPDAGQILNVYINKLIDVKDPLSPGDRYQGDGTTKDFKIPNTSFAPKVYINNTLKELGIDYSLVPFSPVSRIVRFIVAPLSGDEIKIQLYGNEIRLDDPNYSIDTDLISFVGSPSYSIYGGPFDGVDVLGLNGSSYISAAQSSNYAFGTQNFTIEFFVRPDSLPTNNWTPILAIGQNIAGKEIRIGHNIDGNGVGYLIPNNTNNGNVYQGNFHILTPNAWHHIALVKEGNTVYFFVDGVKLNTVNSVSFNFSGLGPLRIGYGLDPANGYFNGSISNVRILKGTALYNDDFEVPDQPFTAITNTVFLTLNTHALNPNAQMKSVIGDGEIDVVELPAYITIDENDRITIRKNYTDGSNVIGFTELDTQLSGGQFVGSAFTSATGLEPDDIIVDGDELVTELNSTSPEELLPGRIFDSVAIKVYHRPTGGAPKILFKNYVSDGSNDTFKIGQYFPTDRSVIVKVSGEFLDPIDYTIDWKNNNVVLADPPEAGSLVSIVSLGFNANNILDTDYFIGDGVTKEFITKAPWLDELNATVLVDGSVLNFTLFKTDSTYDVSNLVGIRFANSIDNGSLINYLIDTDSLSDVTQQTSSVMKSQIINFVSGTSTYNLINLTQEKLTALNLQPYENNVLVRKGQTFLQPSKTLNFVLTNNTLEYKLSPYEADSATFDITQVRVFIAGIELKVGKDFTVDFYGVTVKINKRKYIDGAAMIVVISAGSDYNINDNGSITFTSNYPTGTEIEVISFYNHAILKVERSVNSLTPANVLVPGSADYYTFTNKLGQRFKLDRPVSTDDYIWVIKNGQMLTHSVDYSLELDHRSVRLKTELDETDIVQVIAFNSEVVTYSVSYMQFKDILNRVHFKRLNKNKQTRLAQDLKFDDTYILVEDSSQFDQPNINANKPGVIEIKGERIEYFEIDGNALLRLRRGTLGTGVPAIHKEGSYVIDIGPQETIPYLDTELIENHISDGTRYVNLTFIPIKGDQDTASPNYDTSGVVKWFADYNLNYKGEYISGSQYVSNDVVSYQSGYYTALVGSRSVLPTNTEYWAPYDTEIPVGFGMSNDIEVLVGGYDLTQIWEPNTLYTIGTLITKDSYSYKCQMEHTSSSSFMDDYNFWKIFVGNRRLSKVPYSYHNMNKFVYSPEGDEKIEADFAVDGENPQLLLTNELAVGTRITVVKKTGFNWDNNLYGDNQIASFLRAAPAVWYTNMSNE